MRMVEERVRRALREDGARLEVPARPSVADLERRAHPGPWRWVVVAGAATALLVLVAVTVVALTPRGLVEIGPADDPMPAHDLLVNPDPGEVIAEGTVDDVRWRAVARDGQLLCVGVRVDGDEVSEGRTTCGQPQGSHVQVAHVAAADAGLVVVGGWVRDDVDRVVWELPEGELELELHRRPDLPARVFAGGGRAGEQVSIVRVYDHAGSSLSGYGIPGARTDVDEPE